MNSRWPGGEIWLATRNNYETVTQPLQGTVQSPSLGSFLSWQNFLSLKQLDLSVQSQGNKWASCSRSSHSTTATIYVDSFLLFIWIFISSGSRKCLLHWFVITYVKAVGTVPTETPWRNHASRGNGLTLTEGPAGGLSVTEESIFP